MEFTSFVLAVVIASSLGPENIVRRIDLGEAVMVLPEGYRPQGGRADVILHMHGAGSVVEKALVESGWQGPLLLFNRKGLSSVYSEPFRDPALFPLLSPSLDGIDGLICGTKRFAVRDIPVDQPDRQVLHESCPG
jgi:hypothetical protein